MASSNDGLRQWLKDEGRKRWILAGQALLTVKKALVPFCEDTMKSFHSTLVEKNSKKQCENSDCLSVNVKFDNGWKLSQPCDVCDKWLAAIVSHKACGTLHWKNCIIKQWPESYWDVAKVYMESGQKPSNTGPSHSDLSGLLTLINQCDIFSSKIEGKSSVNDVKSARNCIMHEPELKLTEAELLKYIKVMINLLEDETELKGSAKCQEAVKVLNELKKMQIDISDQNVIFKLEEDEVILLKEILLDLKDRQGDNKGLREDIIKALDMVSSVESDHNRLCDLEDKVTDLMSLSDRVTAVEEQNQAILTKLEKRPDTVKETSSTRDMYEMSAVDKLTLRKNHNFMIHNITWSSVFLAKLYDVGLISNEQQEHLNNNYVHPTSSSKIHHLLCNILPRKGPDAFDLFISVLEEEDHHHHVAERLRV